MTPETTILTALITVDTLVIIYCIWQIWKNRPDKEDK